MNLAELATPGVRIGHSTDAAGRTGCTVVVFDQPATASGEVRGSAPATREFALLDPTATVQRIDAVVLSGGSAFGLAAAGGVVRELEADGRGFETEYGRVPIVVGMSLFDLGVGLSTARPTEDDGAAAVRTAATAFDLGPVGAGSGATVAKWRGEPQPGGLGHAIVRADDVVVEAVVAVNAYGELLSSETGLGAYKEIAAAEFDWEALARPFRTGENTTIGVIITNAVLTKTECSTMARAGHDGMARALFPAHTAADGDALVAVSSPVVEAAPSVIATMASVAVEQAISSVGGARP